MRTELTNNKHELYKLFAGNTHLWGFKYNSNRIDISPKKFDIATVRYIAESEADHAEYLHRLFYPCIFLHIGRDRWSYFASKEHAEIVLKEMTDFLGFKNGVSIFSDIMKDATLNETMA